MGVDVASVDAELGDDGGERVVDLGAGDRRVQPRVGGEPLEPGGEPGDVAAEVAAEHLDPGPMDAVLEALGVAGEPGVEVVERGRGGGVDAEGGEQGAELVPGAAVRRPGVGELLVVLEDLLDHDPSGAGRLPEPVEVAGGIAEPVDVVDAKPVDAPPAHQPGDHRVDLVEDPRLLDPDPGEAADGEEAAVVQPLGGVPPVGQQPVLPVAEVEQGRGVGAHRAELGGQRGRRPGPGRGGGGESLPPAAPGGEPRLRRAEPPLRGPGRP